MKLTEKKFRVVKGMVITEVKGGAAIWYNVYTMDEWSMGRGYRYPEFEGCILEEAISQAKNYDGCNSVERGERQSFDELPEDLRD